MRVCKFGLYILKNYEIERDFENIIVSLVINSC